MTCRPTLIACALALAAFASTTGATEKYRSAQEILDASPASDWRTLDPANTLYMDVEGGRVVIELAPAFAPEHVANIRTLARGHFWDGLSIYRSQDNFVVQFGDPDADEAGKARSLGSAKTRLPAEFERPSQGLAFDALPDTDGWADRVGFVDGLPAAQDDQDGTTWLAHCYGALGAGRNMEADSSVGAELYVVTGQSPRQLDRNITLVGRVVKGMELLSAIPRGPEPMGFYEDAEQRAPIRAIRLASELPPAERLPLQLLRTDSTTFAEATEARRNRRDDFYKRPAGHIDLCNVPLPVRLAPATE
ncbi:peptidylprolyl isomerase [Flavobacterium sp. MXW15]|uniref:peptidylprolyl isomerase n=1 Tax=Xanthomonas chitinilytica TaxID=2989819 RepID=A0ABT3JV09_9XANT|nr:peptidylprolyl isomerase [Xanthomonas sp. H13-6]MCW4453335.1 peptidylprolyl isomerase [Flavobacterium sp. MXW15]MCW4472312.1 peptidylprolyl isomerase [Xanthomonas sp. H13-6]